ncbi:hypothetical protein [Mycobacterium asiaticum]|uniref:Transmembrane protein n=1 Tax=Mycobacterium asiaticum TaxID=1790 RepID=A0A1A3NMI7_MYCAS|nr:hypothetical protein [Mycobacterium asiaticum]OBK23353.1 hypothetical protein A5635_01385 [Mycobacterium asiaticum]
MTGPESEETKQISVAELLARNGTIGAPAVTRRRRRRRGDDSISVAELTGEIPVIRDERHEERRQEPPRPAPANSGVQVAEPDTVAPPVEPKPVEPPVEPKPVEPKPVEAKPVEAALAEPEADVEPETKSVYWSEPEPRWPKSEPIGQRKTGPERSEYPRPLRHLDVGLDVADEEGQRSGAEGMSPDPVGHYTDASVDVMDSEVREAETAVEDSAYVRSYLHGSDDGEEHTLFGGQSLADEVARRRSVPDLFDKDEPQDSERAVRPRRSSDRMAAIGGGLLTVLQSILAVAFGAGLFIAFDQLWRWNSIVALVLSVLVILGLVVGVRVVRKTEDIASTLIAVAVGALITLGPMALLQTG